MKTIRVLETFYAVDAGGNSVVKYRAGDSYPPDEETTRLVAAGIAVEIDAPDPVGPPPAA